MPGKYERATDPDRAELLHAESLDGSCWDEWTGGDVWHGLMGRYVLHEDGQGFFTYDEHASDGEARAAFEVLRGTTT